MKLEALPKNKGLKRKKKCLGRGPGSGRGKTCGRGHKGQKARSGGSVKPIFEGGQSPLARRLPYSRGRGFKNYDFRTDFDVINVGDLEKLDAAITEVTREVLVVAGLVRQSSGLIKILGNGELKRSLAVEADAFSASARSKIEAAGGKILEKKNPLT